MVQPGKKRPLCGAVSDFYPPLINLIGDIKVFGVGVVCALAGRLLAVDLQSLFRLVVLVEVHCVCVSLGGNEEISPYHEVNDVADLAQLSLSGAASINFLFLAQIDDGAFSEGHTATCVALEVWLDGAGCIDSPVDEAHVGYFKGESQAGVALEVPEQAMEFGPVVFIGVLDACCDECKGHTTVVA